MVTEAELPGWLRRLYPFTPRRHARGRHGMSYVDEGPPADEAVLLVHGNPTWSFHFRDLIRALTAAGWRCVAPDHLGMGLSDKPPDYPYRLATHIGNLGSLVDRLGLRRVHLVVHDWGGAIACGWAGRQPERIGKLVVMNTAAFPAPHIPLRINLCRTPGLGEWAVRRLNAFARAATTMTMHRRRLDPDVRRAYLFPYDSPAHRIAVARFVQDIPMRADHPSRPVLEETARSLERLRGREALIAWGGADFCFHRWFYDEWRRRLPEARTHFVADAGHYLLEDAGIEIVPTIKDFLGRPS